METIDSSILYFGNDIDMGGGIKIRQPKLSQILFDMGEQGYLSTVNAWTSIPSDAKSMLDENGIDYAQISDFEYFMMLSRGLNAQLSEQIVSGFNPAKAVPKRNTQNDEIVLFDEENKTVIDRFVHGNIMNVLCQMHGYVKERETAGNKAAREFFIEEDKALRKRRKEEGPKSTLQPLVSALIAKAGLHGQMEKILNMTFFQLRDAIRRYEAIDLSYQIGQGIYVGMLDTKKINKEYLNWTRVL